MLRRHRVCNSCNTRIITSKLAYILDGCGSLLKEKAGNRWFTRFLCNNIQTNFMFVVPYILVTYMFNSGPARCTLYSLFPSSLALRVSGAICTNHQHHNCSVQP
jgi:hypothetical protein